MIKTSESFDELFVPAGFLFAAATAGIKQSGKPDMAIALAPDGANAAAMFTRNRVVAAPVTVGREHLSGSRGKVRAIVVNSGNANCATGAAGIRAAREVCSAAARAIGCKPHEVVPSSTGIIGVPLPTAKLLAAMPDLVGAAKDPAIEVFARAIMTTDTRPKVASVEIKTGRNRVRVLGVAKGAGMIHPNMATMLVYVFTDVQAPTSALRSSLRRAANATLNCISIDGDTSTNDTAVLLASGASGVGIRALGREFDGALHDVCRSLARQIVSDGEGVKHVITLKITGASYDTSARKIAASIANSPLVKTAWAGCDPNWGRILCAIGNADVTINPAKVSIAIGPHRVCVNGEVGTFDADETHAFMQQREFEIGISVGSGRGSCEYVTCDLTAEYVHINADYST